MYLIPPYLWYIDGSYMATRNTLSAEIEDILSQIDSWERFLFIQELKFYMKCLYTKKDSIFEKNNPHAYRNARRRYSGLDELILGYLGELDCESEAYITKVCWAHPIQEWHMNWEEKETTHTEDTDKVVWFDRSIFLDMFEREYLLFSDLQRTKNQNRERVGKIF